MNTPHTPYAQAQARSCKARGPTNYPGSLILHEAFDTPRLIVPIRETIAALVDVDGFAFVALAFALGVAITHCQQLVIRSQR